MHRRNASVIQIGSTVVARRAHCIFSSGETGVCYQIFRIRDQLGYSIIFEKGGYDRFSAEDALWSLDISGQVCEAVANYRFKNVRQLVTDYQLGRFAAAFAVSRGTV
jgi:hypothetical protein